MSRKSVMIGRWSYLFPDTERNAEGRIVLIEKRSFGPLETYDWGIDENNEPYEQYEWLENDLYDDDHLRHITEQELEEKLGQLVSLFDGNGLSEWAEAYRRILDGCRSGYSF